MNWEDSNLPESWKRFQQHCELIFSGPLKSKPDDVSSKYLLLWIGEKGRDIYNTWTLTELENKQTNFLFDKFKQHVQPKLNPVFARFKFNMEMQGSKSIEQFITMWKLWQQSS